MSDSEKPKGPQQDTDKPSQRITIDELGLTASIDAGEQSFSPKDFLFIWFKLYRTAQIHTIANQALQQPIQNFIAATNKLLAIDGSVSLQSKDGTLFVNSIKLNLSSDEYNDAAEPVFAFFEERGMGGFVIDDHFTNESLHQLLNILVYSTAKGRSFKTIDSELKAANLPFRINKQLGVKNKGSSEVVLERRAYAFLTYSKLVVLCRTLMTEKEGNPAKRHYVVKKVTRTIEALVDICLEDDHTFLGISSVKSEEAYAPHHAANTAVLAIALGEKLGLGKVALADLGIAAALCDVGLREIPPSVIEKRDALDPGEQEIYDRHPLLSVKFFLEDRHYTKSVLRRIVVAYEHHQTPDTGNKHEDSSYSINLFTQIVAIAEAYDAMTTHRPGRKASLPDEALGLMLAESGTKFDTLLLKIFINTMGLYPVGTLVRLTNGEIGLVVYGGGEGDRVHRPIISLLDSDGKPSQSVDLAEKDASGNYIRQISSSEDPAKYGLQPSGLLSHSPVA